MLVMLGDQITLMKGETWITGRVSGVVLDDKKELERVYLHDLSAPFWMHDNWRIVDEDEEMEIEDDEI